MKRNLFLAMAMILTLESISSVTVSATESGTDVVKLQEVGTTDGEIGGEATTDAIDATNSADIAVLEGKQNFKPAPKLTVVESLQDGAKVKVTYPAGMRAEGVKYVKIYFSAICEEDGYSYGYYLVADEDDSEIFTLNDMPAFGTSWTVSGYLQYHGQDNEEIGTSDRSNTITFKQKNPYETTLKCTKSAKSVSQNDVDVAVVGDIIWKNAYEKRRKVTFEVASCPKSADKEAFEKVIYNVGGTVILDLEELDWSKIPAGKYVVNMKAEQKIGAKPASTKFTVTVNPVATTMEVQTGTTRYYKPAGKGLSIHPSIKIYDTAGSLYTLKDAVYSLKFKNKPAETAKQCFQIDPKNGKVTVDANLKDTVEFQIQATFQNGTTIVGKPTLTVSPEPMQIAGAKIGSETVMAGKTIDVHAVNINGKKVKAFDASETAYTATKYTVKASGSSLKVGKDWTITTTGKAGVTTLTISAQDGSKEKQQIKINVLPEMVEGLLVEHQSTDMFFLSEQKSLEILGAGNCIRIAPLKADKNVLKKSFEPTYFSMTANKGKLVEEKVNGKATGYYCYYPKSGADTITVVDKDGKTTVKKQYPITLPEYGEESIAYKAKPGSISVYTRQSAVLESGIVLDTTDKLTNVTAKLAPNYEKNSGAKLENAKKLAQNLNVTSVKENHLYVSTVDETVEIPAGTYEMYAILSGEQTYKPVAIKIVVKKVPKPTLTMTTKFNIPEGKHRVAVTCKTKNVSDIRLDRLESYRSPITKMQNDFSYKFELYRREEIQYFAVKFYPYSMKDVRVPDRRGYLVYKITDLAGIESEYMVPVTVTSK